MNKNIPRSSSSEATDAAYVQTLTELYQSGARDAHLGNQVAHKLLERCIEQPLEYIKSDTAFKNKFYFDLLLKSFKERILNEASFDLLKILALLIRNKENYTFFFNNFGFEFLYQVVLENPVFVDDLSPAKSISIMLDTILYNARQDEIRYLITLFFSSEIQDKIDFFANFLSDFVSILMVTSKLGKNPEIMPALANNKLYLVDEIDNRTSSASTRKGVLKSLKKSAASF